MKKCRIPKENADLRKYAFFTNFKRIVFFMGYCALWVLAYKFYLDYSYINKPLVWWALLIFGVLVGASGWFICSMTAFVRERSFSGKIEKMKVYREYSKGNPGVRAVPGSRSKMDIQLYRGLIIRDERGKKRKLRFKMRDSGFDGYYTEGGHIAYFRGTQYPLCFEGDEGGACMCVICGSRNYAEWRDGKQGNKPTHCSLCGYSIIDVKKLR